MEWIKYKCEECSRGFAIEEDPADRLDEPCCPECGGDNCTVIDENIKL